ncbi:hypothetical protein GCM10009632_26630 [Mycolicibacterium alvei]|uniref:Uncharacterized protein n=1 Tax=Mycolicibacterium alvei TaxID=67081 RepID=A0A6N4UYT8_9MYCO|nr:hypothetical protein MALV_47440 [Mycolicibacterium alvei]
MSGPGPLYRVAASFPQAGPRHTTSTRCPKTVKDCASGVKKPSRPRSWLLPGQILGKAAEIRRPVNVSSNGDGMSVLLYLVLTVAIFALLGLVQKLVEGL